MELEEVPRPVGMLLFNGLLASSSAAHHPTLVTARQLAHWLITSSPSTRLPTDEVGGAPSWG
jgi:hypothetical protein